MGKAVEETAATVFPDLVQERLLMNKMDIATLSMAVAPEVITEIRDAAWDGTVSVERIYGLSFAITTALDAVANEAMSRRGQTDAEPITNMREWAVISSLMDLLKDQAETCGRLFEKAEIATGKATRGDRVAKIAGLHCGGPVG